MRDAGVLTQMHGNSADCMLLFQVGDFYEFFGDDARRASHVRTCHSSVD